MISALDNRGQVVGVLADSLMKSIRQPLSREAIEAGRLCFITPYHPDAPFSVGNAMGRNALIYALSEHAVVVSSDVGKGGTWEGAMQAMRKKLAPVHVVEHDRMPEGNRELIRRGAKALTVPFAFEPSGLKDHLDAAISEALAQEDATAPGGSSSATAEPIRNSSGPEAYLRVA